ncbi:MAG: hypothetical protein ACR2M0_04330 [Chloroflexia bacterium]
MAAGASGPKPANIARLADADTRTRSSVPHKPFVFISCLLLAAGGIVSVRTTTPVPTSSPSSTPTPPGHGTPVTWATPLVNARITPTDNSIQKTSGPDGVWDAGAVSSQAIASDNGGNGYVLISLEGRQVGTPTPTSTPGARRAFGLSSSSRFHGHRLQDLDFAFVLTGTNSLDVYECGAYVAQVGIYDYNDVLKVAVEDAPGHQGKVVRYYRNGGAVYTTTNPLLDYPLQL